MTSTWIPARQNTEGVGVDSKNLDFATGRGRAARENKIYIFGSNHMRPGTLREKFPPASILSSTGKSQCKESLFYTYITYILSIVPKHEYLLVTPIAGETRNSSHRQSGELNKCYVKYCYLDKHNRSFMLSTTYTRSRLIFSASDTPCSSTLFSNHLP